MKKTIGCFGVVALLFVSFIGARAAAEERTISGDASLNQAMQQFAAEHGILLLDLARFESPLAPAHVTGSPLLEGESGDALLMSAVSTYTRAALDRGGWENPFVRDAQHYATGNALLGVQAGEGVTAVVASR